MTRWVSLATDANPHYAVYAPIVTRIWKQLGYKPVLFVHNQGWDTAFGQFVRENLPDDVPVIETPRLDPMSVGNTMRMIRLAACACSFIESNDLIITSDIDMAPLSRTFFDRQGPAFILRVDAYGPLEGATQLLDGDKGIACLAGLFRFPMCYVGLERDIWRDITPYRPAVEGNPIELARRILHGCRGDQHDYDEQFVSARTLLSRWAAGSLVQMDGRWRQGELEMVGSTDWPGGWPLGMIIGGTPHRPAGSLPIDFHMPKPSNRATGGVLGQHWPEEGKFLEHYWFRAIELAGFSG